MFALRMAMTGDFEDEFGLMSLDVVDILTRKAYFGVKHDGLYEFQILFGDVDALKVQSLQLKVHLARLRS